MQVLRRAWLVAIVVSAALGGGSALAMRIELFDAGATFSPDVHQHALTLHALAMVGMILGALVAIPTLVVRAGHAASVLGTVAFVAWALVMVVFTSSALAPPDWLAGALTASSLRASIIALAVSAGAAVVQLAASLSSAKPRDRYVGIGAIVALAVVAIPLAKGELPAREHLLAAVTVVACSMVPATRGSSAMAVVWFAIAPCVAVAGLAYAVVLGSNAAFLPDTVAVLAMFPALGGAALAALFAAATRERAVPQARLRAGAALFGAGTVATSLGFLLLGTRGMPRRYHQYDALFEPLQVFVGVAVVVALAGAIVAVLAVRSASRSSPRT